MEFINKYKKNLHKYYVAQEVPGDGIYAVGDILIDGMSGLVRGLVTKLNLDGTVLWEHDFAPEGIARFSFKKMVACDNGDILVSGRYNTEKVNLVRLTPNGDLVWSKAYFDKGDTTVKYNGDHLVKYTNGQYVLVLNETRGNQQNLLKICIFNETGSVVKQTTFDVSGKFNLNTTTINNDGNIVVVGETQDDILGRISVVLAFNSNLEIIYNQKLKPFENTKGNLRIDGVYVNNGNYWLYGYRTKENNSGKITFIANLGSSLQDIPSEIKVKKFPQNISGGGRILFHPQEGIYMQNRSATSIFFSKFDYSFNSLGTWEFLDDSFGNVLSQVTDTHVLFNRYVVDSYVGKIGLDLDASLTKKISPIQVTDDIIYLHTPVTTQIKDFSGNLEDIHIAVTNVVSKIEDIANKSLTHIDGFLNQYIKQGTDLFNNYDVLEVKDDGVYLASSNLSRQVVLLKVSVSTGEIIWEKTLNIPELSNATPSLLSCDNRDILLEAKSYSGYFLARITVNGDVKWSKFYDVKIKDSFIYKILTKLPNNEYLFFTKDNRLVKIDGDGNILATYLVSLGETTQILKVFYTPQNNILLLGNIKDAIVFAKLDQSTTIIDQFTLTYTNDLLKSIKLNNAVYDKEQVIFSGTIAYDNTISQFIGKLDVSTPVNDNPVDIKLFQGYDLGMQSNSDFSFVQTYYNSLNGIFKFDSNLELVWFKTLDIPNFFLSIFGTLTESHVLFTDLLYSKVGRLNHDLESCRTLDLPLPQLETIQLVRKAYTLANISQGDSLTAKSLVSDTIDTTSIVKHFCALTPPQNQSGTFLCKYTKSPHHYTDIIEIPGDGIYAVGQVRTTDTLLLKRGLITKLDFTGQVLWEYDFVAQGFDWLGIDQVVVSKNGVVLRATTLGESFLVKLSSTGKLLWGKKLSDLFSETSITTGAIKLSSYDNGNILLLVEEGSGRNQKTFKLFEINERGEVTKQKNFNTDILNHSSRFLCANTSTIVLVGSGSKKDTGNLTAVTVFNHNFEVEQSFIIKSFSDKSGFFNIHGVTEADGKYWIHGETKVEGVSKNLHFILDLGDLKTPVANELSIKTFRNPDTGIEGIVPVSDDLTLTVVTKNEITYFNHHQKDLGVTKTQQFLDDSIGRVLWKATGDHVLLNRQGVNGYLGRLGSNLESCLTKDASIIEVQDIMVYTEALTVTGQTINELGALPDHIMTRQLVISIKEDICSTQFKKTDGFLNKYERDIEKFYMYAAEVENDGVYVVGSTSDGTSAAASTGAVLLMKLTPDGDQIWEKNIDVPGLKSYTVVSFIKCKNNGILLQNYDDSGKCYLVRVSSEGAILWSKDYNISAPDDFYYGVFGKLVQQVSENEYLVFDKGGLIFKINDQGEVIGQSYQINGIGELTKVIYTDEGNILAIGNNNNQVVVVTLDTNFNVINQFSIAKNESNPLHFAKAVQYNNKINFLIYEDLFGGTNSRIIGQIDLKNLPTDSIINARAINDNGLGVALHEGFSLLHVQDNNINQGSILKLDNDLQPVWYKTLDIKDFSSTFFGEITNKFVYMLNADTTGLVGRLNHDLDSCKTVNLAVPDVQTVQLKIKPYSTATITGKTLTAPQNLDVIATGISSIKHEVCFKKPVVPVDLGLFLNRYNKADHEYKQVLEVGNDGIYAVGKINGTSTDKGLITKTDFNGKVLWEKDFENDGGNGQIFTQILAADNGDLMVLGKATSNDQVSLTRITTQGEVLWSKFYGESYTNIGYYAKLLKLPNETYVIQSDRHYLTGNNADITTILYKLDKDGNITRSVILKDIADIIFRIYCNSSNRIVIGGHNIIIFLDESLDVIKSISCSLGSGVFPVGFWDASNIDGDFWVSGSIQMDQQNGPIPFIVKINENQALFADVEFTGFTGIGNYEIQIHNSKGFLYLKTLSKEKTNTVHKLSKDLDIIWSKQITTEAKLALDQATPDNIIIHGYDGDHFIGRLDTELKSCKTVSLSPAQTTKIKKQFFNAGASSEDNGLGQNTGNVNFVVTDVVSVKEEICPFGSGDGDGDLVLDPSMVLQSPFLYVQSAGSTGHDGSAKGIHLRWTLKGHIGDYHIPKGNLSNATHSFNKKDDFVKIYRTPYTKNEVVIDFNAPPNLIFDNKREWVYDINKNIFHIYFKDIDRYNQSRGANDPSKNPMAFIQVYGDALIEIENKKELSFGATFVVNDAAAGSKLATEVLTVDENKITAQKHVGARKTFLDNKITSANIVGENIRSVRFLATNCIVSGIKFEFYSNFITKANTTNTWEYVGRYGLTIEDTKAFELLEPRPGLVHGSWPRYNGNALVNIENYKKKWNDAQSNDGQSIKGVIQKYIQLSDASSNNPLANEDIFYPGDLDDGSLSSFKVSYLDLLQIASIDYHIARMLGLGYLDTSVTAQNEKYVYLAVYNTKADPNNGTPAKDQQHIYMSLPTSIEDQRLPLPIDLKEPVPGLQYNKWDNPTRLTDEQGYTHDGKTRFITLYAEDLPEFADKDFYQSGDKEYNLAAFTFPVNGGLEYKDQNETDWRAPELSSTSDYLNVVPDGDTPYGETIPLGIPDLFEAFYVHREKNPGAHVYGSYGINWFGRASQSAITWTIETKFKPSNLLLPPSNLSAVLIKKEKPLLLTSSQEQELYSAITGGDKTLVRLYFDYNSFQELVSYKLTEQDLAIGDWSDPNYMFPDKEEVFADEVEIFFRKNMPNNVIGKAISIADDPENEIVSVIRTGAYKRYSDNSLITPTLDTNAMANFIGGVFILEEEEYIIHNVKPSDIPKEGPVFIVYKKEISDSIQSRTVPDADADLEAPEINADGMFMAIENMLNQGSWGTPNPHSFKISIGDNWQVHREKIQQDGADTKKEQVLEKTRGIWGKALIEEIIEDVDINESTGAVIQGHAGLYKITFENDTVLNDHPQYSASGNSVNWDKGVVRVHTKNDSNGPRKTLQVIKIENIGTTGLTLYVSDLDFQSVEEAPENTILTGQSIEVNFYPGYKVYLYANTTIGLTENIIQPTEGEGVRYTIFGSRSKDNKVNYASDISVPATMFAQEIIEPRQPELPKGAQYASRPDTFGKSTYTLTTKFKAKPHSVMYYRCDENSILNALYTFDTVKAIKEAIKTPLGKEEYVVNRWTNLLRFDYNYKDNTINQNGQFAAYPDTKEGYRLPNPNKPSLFFNGETPGSILPGNMIDRIKDAVFNAFTPLTEIPLLFKYIRGKDYEPLPKKQVVRSKNGSLLQPEDSNFDIAPMAKKLSEKEVLFTDFTLQGTSENIFFYTVREIGNTMQMGDFSPVLGPVKLVNTNPSEAPEVKRALPVLSNKTLNVLPAIQLEINAYPLVQQVERIHLYRTLNADNALSVRTMDLVKTIDILQDKLLGDNVWKIKDEFEDIGYVPYAEVLYYKVTVSRKVEYATKEGNIVTEYAPSNASKLVISTILENTTPESPTLFYSTFSEDGLKIIDNPELRWDKVIHNGKYHLYKMNEQGNWVKIYGFSSNKEKLVVSLSETNYGSDKLIIEDDSGNPLYHHFKVRAENSSGMLSLTEHILTIPNKDSKVVLGIGTMVVGTSNVVGKKTNTNNQGNVIGKAKIGQDNIIG